MAKKNQDQDNTEVQPVEAEQEQVGGVLNQENAPEEKRVAQNGEVHDPGNSGLLGEDFTEGSVTGQADKQNG